VKMKAVLALVALCALSVPALSSGQQLYPVSGPAASQTPPPPISANLHGAGGSGSIALIFADGEIFKGKWAYLRPTFVNNQTAGTVEGYPPQPSLDFAWDAVFGKGYFLANVLGEPIAQAILTGDKKTILQLEFFNGKWGVAADSKGNIYKMTW